MISCKKKVIIDLNSKNPNLPVFSGWISGQSGNQEIIIKSTSNYSSNSVDSYLTTANVNYIDASSSQYFSLNGNVYKPNSNFSFTTGEKSIVIQLNGKTYEQKVSVYPPVNIESIEYYDNGVPKESGLLVGFTLPTEKNYAMAFELLADSTGSGNNYISLTPTIHSMELFDNYIDEFNEYGDVVIFKELLDPNNTTILYKLVLHRISAEQYNYLFRIQSSMNDDLYATQPYNLPTMFTNGGLGIVIVSSDSFFEFTF